MMLSVLVLGQDKTIQWQTGPNVSIYQSDDLLHWTWVSNYTNGDTLVVATEGASRSFFKSVSLNPLTLAAPSTWKVSLAWDRPNDSTVIGYKVYWGTSSRTYKWTQDVRTNQVVTIGNLKNNTVYYFAAVSYNSAGALSDYSNEVSYDTSRKQTASARIK